MVNKKDQYKQIIFANIAEAFKNVLDNIIDEREKERRVNLEHNLCHRALFWEKDNKIVITPYAMPLAFADQSCRIMGFKNVKNLFPKKMSGISLSDAIINDKYLWQAINQIIKKNPGINLSTYAVTPEFLKLLELFEKEKLVFQTKEVPQTYSRWTISYLDSKVGFREEALKLQNNKEKVKIPEGFVCQNKEEAKKAATWFYTNNRSCIIKANHGEGGWGLIILKEENFISIQSLEKEIENKFFNDSIWKDELIMVEEFIDPNLNIGGGFPSVELLITDKGTELTYRCGQIFKEGGSFLGVIMGKKLMDNKINTKLTYAASAIGERYRKLGYRGFFDIDFVISRNGEPYAIETNARRTGGTHIFDIAKRIFGSNWEKNAYFFSQDSFRYGGKSLPADVLIKKMDQILFPIQSKQKGVIITLVNQQLPIFGFVIVAPTLLEMKDLYVKLCKVWQLKHNNFILPE